MSQTIREEIQEIKQRAWEEAKKEVFGKDQLNKKQEELILRC